MSKIKKDNLTVSQHLSESVALLQKRQGITPNHLSNYLGSHLMQIILPALFFVRHQRGQLDYSEVAIKTGATAKDATVATDISELTDDPTQYQIYFAGNGQDALYDPFHTLNVIGNTPNTIHLFKNYPGIDTDEPLQNIEVLFEDGYARAKTLIDQYNIPPEKITLYGLSLGGGVAAQVARRLHDEGYPVNLTIDRSFSNLSAVVSPKLEHHLQPTKYGRYLPLATSMAAVGFSGTALGTTVAGLITSIGVLLGHLMSNLGYYVSLALSCIPYLEQPASMLNTAVNALSESIAAGFDIMASVTGALVSLTASIAGTALGAVIGAVLSLQLLFTDTPINMPLGFSARACLSTTTGEMNSVDNVQHILKSEEHGHVKIINGKHDDVIHPEASLNTGLGFSDNPARENQHVSSNFSSFWYNYASHCGQLEDDDIDVDLSCTIA